MSAPVVVVMGIAGCGKSTLAAALARTMGAVFVEGDDYHPAENRAAMASGRPLTDEMRRGWLGDLAAIAATEAAAGHCVVMSCSALRRIHRDRLRKAGPLTFLWLDVPEADLVRRVSARRGHFMPASLLPSQIATFEPPGADEPDVIRIAADGPADATLAATFGLLESRGIDGHACRLREAAPGVMCRTMPL